MLHVGVNIVLLSKHLSVVSARATAARTGGKVAGKVLAKPVKPHGKRAEFLRYFLSSPTGRSVHDCMKRFDMKRPNVFAYWTAIHRDHAIGYSLTDNRIIPILPPKHSVKTIFGVK